MKFFDREKEISLIREIRDKSHTSARFTVITGHRRIGKTQEIIAKPRLLRRRDVLVASE